ncbi:MAG: response regulator [Candidatus Dormibacteria bacterium]
MSSAGSAERVGHVLVIEDEPNIAGIILYKLRREGHAVDHADSAASARLLRAPWDVVLLDSSLPGEDAMRLLTELRAGAPVVVMTESRDEETPNLALRLGAAAIVRKPFKPTLLARLVLEVLSLPKGDADHSYGPPAGGLITTMSAPEVAG